MIGSQQIADLPTLTIPATLSLTKDTLNQKQYLELCKLLVNYLHNICKRLSQMRSDLTLKQPSKMIRKQLINQHTFTSCINKATENEPAWQYDILEDTQTCLRKIQEKGKYMEITMLYDCLREAFCSIMEIIKGLANDSREEIDIYELDFLIKEVKQAEGLISYYQNVIVEKCIFQRQEPRNKIRQYTYQPLNSLKNYEFTTIEERQDILKIKQKHENYVKTKEENDLFFRYRVLGTIPHYLNRNPQANNKPENHKQEVIQCDTFKQSLRVHLNFTMQAYKKEQLCKKDEGILCSIDIKELLHAMI